MTSASTGNTPKRVSKAPRFLAFAAIGAALAPFASGGHASVTPTETSNLQCATARSVIGPSDITYLGAIRMPASGVDTTYAAGGLTGRVVNGRVRLFLYGSSVATPRDQIYEIEDPGAGYSTDYTQAPRATLVTTWGDVYHGKRTSWDAQGAPVDLTPTIEPYGLYWNEGTQLLYWTYYDNYNVSHRKDWGLGATSLDNPANGSSTAYGPWRAVAKDADNNQYYGPWRCGYLFSNPLDGSMMCGSTLMSGNSGSPWGPDAFGGRPWPTAATPGGPGTPDLQLPSRYLEHYFMGNTDSGNYVDQNGVVHGHLRAMRRTNEQPIWESAAASNVLSANPALNGGVGSWSNADTTEGGIWLELTNKHAVIFVGTLAGSPVQNPSDCVNASHTWYSNAGVHPPIGACSHGCPPPVQVTGVVTTAAFPAFMIYDPDQMLAVRNGSIPDYSPDARNVIDLQETYHIKTADMNVVGAAKSVRGAYFDPVRKYLYTLAARSDDSRGIRETLIHVFAIRD
jgi:hypothetical protein